MHKHHMASDIFYNRVFKTFGDAKNCGLRRPGGELAPGTYLFVFHIENKLQPYAVRTGVGKVWVYANTYSVHLLLGYINIYNTLNI